MRHIKIAPIVGTAVLCGTCAALAIGCLRYRVPTLSGTWKDVDKDYYVVFQSDGNYRESTYGTPRSFEVTADDRLVLQDQLGRRVSLDLLPTLDGKITVPIDGVLRTLKQAKYSVKLKTETAVPMGILASEVYKLSDSVSLKLWEDQRVFQLSGDGMFDIVGKWAKDSEQGTLVLFSDDGSVLDVLKWTGFGYAASQLSTNLKATPVEANVVELAGYRLDGVVEDDETRLRYVFSAGSNIVERSSPNGELVQFVYGVDANGLVSMVDTLGKGAKDNLWVDLDTLTAYRYVFEYDSWHRFLTEIGGAKQP